MLNPKLKRDEVKKSLSPVEAEGARAANRASRLPVVVWLVLCLIWGSTWLFIKVGLEDLPPFGFAGARFVIAATLLLTLAFIRRTPLPRDRRDWLHLAVTGVLAFTINYGLVFWGEQYVSSGLAALLQAMIPVFGLIIAHFYLPGERITVLKVAGVMLSISGLAVIFANQVTISGTRALWGSAALVLSAAAGAYSNVLVKAHGGHIDRVALAGWQMVFGLVPLLVIGAFAEGSLFNFNWTARAWIAVFYLAIVGSALAFFLYYWLISHMDVTTTMLIALVTPLIAVTLGIIVLGEHLTWRIAVGGACILAGIALITIRIRPSRRLKRVK